ncbi:MAG: DUF481 domain-containing protein [Pontiellaceae bacterium]|nr:DUF481 domain-containing protein [Pontiellaceae bacterium]MBN2784986.1 DUF481 domain-containing protein [Pontiellaceae bacterium]
MIPIRKFFTLLLLSTLTGTYADDTILLKNGDRLTGDILKETEENVYFRSRAFGAVSLRQADIREVHRGSEPDLAAQGKQAPQTGDPALASAPEKKAQSDSLKPEEKKKSKWSGQAGLALAMRESTKFNSTGVTGKDQNETYRFHGKLGWKEQKDQLSWDWTYRYSRDEYEKQDDYLNITQNYTHDFWENYYATAKTMYQQDYRRTIEHEYLQTAEMGIKWVSKPNFELSTSAGGGYHKYDRTNQSSSSEPEEEVSVFFDQSMRWTVVNSLTLIQKYTHLGDLTNYHFVFSAGLENKLIQDLFVRMEYRLDQDTGVSTDDSGYRDRALLTSLLYKF